MHHHSTNYEVNISSQYITRGLEAKHDGKMGSAGQHTDCDTEILSRSYLLKQWENVWQIFKEDWLGGGSPDPNE